MSWQKPSIFVVGAVVLSAILLQAGNGLLITLIPLRMSRINDRLVEITDTAEPLVTHSLALVASVERANTLAEEIAGSQSLEEIDGIRAEFSELRSRFLDRTESLFGAAAGLGIDDKKVALQEQHAYDDLLCRVDRRVGLEGVERKGEVDEIGHVLTVLLGDDIADILAVGDLRRIEG